MRRCLWGLDLSGSRRGAGGIGGLLVESTAPALVGALIDFLPFYDGNGNITGLTDVGGDEVARYTYGPFGEPVRTTGAMAKGNPFRFSTHYTDVETGLVYAKRRYYTAVSGRWLSRDPFEEHGGDNLYGYVTNSTVDFVDPFGMVGSAVVPTADGWANAMTGERGSYTGTGGRPDSLNRPANALEKAFWNTASRADRQRSAIAKKLRAHFMEASGETLVLTKDEMRDVQPELDMRMADRYGDIMMKLHSGQTPLKMKNVWIKGAAREKGTLGQFYGVIDGTFCGDGSRWTFTGKVHFVDYWDFASGAPEGSPAPPIPNPGWGNDRTSGGQWKADIANENMPGKGFNVKSKKVGVTASHQDPILIFNGAPTLDGFGD